GNYAVPKSMYVVGAIPELGQLEPNRVEMYDDGTHGDQRAGDRVWSLKLRLTSELRRIPYVYTNSGQKGVWNGMDVPYIRTLVLDEEPQRIYAPIDTFGRVYMQADAWHADAAGYDLIAAAVSDAIASNSKFHELVH